LPGKILFLRLGRPRIFYGWWIVAISFLANAVPTGLFFVGFSVLFLPISRDLGVSRAAASLPFSLVRLISAIQSPLIGVLLDRIGPAKVLFTGSLFAGLGFVLLSQVNGYLMFLLVFMIVLAPAVLGGFDPPAMATTSRWFSRKRSLAISIAVMGFGFGGAAVTPSLAAAISAFGWRNTTLVVGVLIWAIYIPLSTRLYSTPESRGLQPDGEPSDAVSQSKGGGQARPEPAVPTAELTASEALRTNSFWLLTASLATRGMIFSALLIHMVAIMVSKGVEEATAGLLIGIFPLTWMPVALSMAWLGDRWSRRRVAALGGFVSALGILLLLLFETVAIWQMILVFVLLSASEGSWIVAWTMLAEEFGRKNFGLLRVMGTVSLMSVGAPFYAGWIFDRFGDYQWLLFPSTFVLALAGFLNWIMPKVAPIPRLVGPSSTTE